MNTIIPDGITKEFQVSTISDEILQILIYDGIKYTEAKFTFNEYKNTVVFDKAPAKGSVVLIQCKSRNGGLEPK